MCWRPKLWSISSTFYTHAFFIQKCLSLVKIWQKSTFVQKNTREKCWLNWHLADKWYCKQPNFHHSGFAFLMIIMYWPMKLTKPQFWHRILTKTILINNQSFYSNYGNPAKFSVSSHILPKDWNKFRWLVLEKQ